MTIQEEVYGKEFPTLEERLQAMGSVSDATPTLIQQELDNIKSMLPLLKESAQLIKCAEENGFAVGRFTDKTKKISYWGYNAFAYQFNDDSSPSEKSTYFIDYKGDVFDSAYECKRQGDNLEFCDTFKVSSWKGTSIKEERKAKRLSVLRCFIHALNDFHACLCNEIDRQLLEKKKGE